MRLPLILTLLFFLFGCGNKALLFIPKDSPSLLKSWRETLPLSFQSSSSPTYVTRGFEPKVTLNNNGDAIVVWRQYNGPYGLQVYKSHFKDGAWIHPESLGDSISFKSSSTDWVEAALDDSGNIIIVWVQSVENSSHQVFKSEYRNGEWDHPDSISDNITPDGRSAYSPRVKMNNSGTAIITWRQQEASYKYMLFKSEYRNGSWTHPGSLTDYFSPTGSDCGTPEVSLNENGDVLIVWSQAEGFNYQVFESEYRGGVWTHPTDLTDNISPNKSIWSLSASMNDNGHAIIVWTQGDSANKYQVFKSEYRGSWSHPSGFDDNISPDGYDAYQAVAKINNNGDALIAWYQNTASGMRAFKSEYFGAWVHPADINSFFSLPGQSAGSVTVALNDAREAVIAWTQHDGTNSRLFKAERRSNVWTFPASNSDYISPNAYNTYYPSIALNQSGDAIIAWAQGNNVFDGVFISEYRSGGWTHPLGIDDNLNARGHNASDVNLALSENGDAVVVWTQSDGTNAQVFKSEFRDGAWIHPDTLNDNISPAGQDADDPTLAMDEDGNTIIVWGQSNGTEDMIYKSEYLDGEWTHPSGLADSISPTGGDAYWPRIKMNRKGDAVVSWAQYDGSYDQIFKSEKRNGMWTHPSNINDNISPDGEWAYDTYMAINEKGDTVIVWFQSDGNTDQVFKSEYRSGVWTHPSSLTDNISPDTTWPNYYLDAGMDKDGNTVIAWSQEDDNGDTNVYKSEYRSGSWSHPPDLDDPMVVTGGWAEGLRIRMNEQGQAIIVWTDYGTGSKSQVYVSRFYNGAWIHPSSSDDSITDLSYSAQNIALDLNEKGEAIVAWRALSEIYLKKFSDESWGEDLLVIEGTHPAAMDATLNDDGKILVVANTPFSNGSKTGIQLKEFR